jgi:hypothetical protein
LSVPQEERAKAVQQLVAAKKDLSALEKELKAYGACDPVKVDEKRRAVILAKEAAIRWTGEYSLSPARNLGRERNHDDRQFLHVIGALYEADGIGYRGDQEVSRSRGRV